MGTEKPFAGRLRLSLEQRLSGHVEADGTRARLLSRTLLAASYSPLAWLSVAAQLPWVTVVRYDSPRAPVWHSGLGDLELYGRALVYRDRSFSPRHLLGVLLGLKLPTGPRIRNSAGYPAADDEQPGSGSWDPVLGASYAYFGGRLSVQTSASYRHSTFGRRDYKRGAQLGGSAALQYAAHPRLGLGLGTDVLYQRSDEMKADTGEPVTLTATGGVQLALTPQLLWSPRTDWLLRLAVQLPVLQRWHDDHKEYPTLLLGLVIDI